MVRFLAHPVDAAEWNLLCDVDLVVVYVAYRFHPSNCIFVLIFFFSVLF